jgi:hypothetical protein
MLTQLFTTALISTLLGGAASSSAFGATNGPQEECEGSAKGASACAEKSPRSDPWPASIIPANFHPGHYLLLGPSESVKRLSLIEGNDNFQGVKRHYIWRDLEPNYDDFDFSKIDADLAIVRRMGKQLFLQIRPNMYKKSRSPNVPSYMWKDERFGCGPQYFGAYKRMAQKGGWLPCYWNDYVVERYQALMWALGGVYATDPNIEGIALDETAMDTNAAIAARSGYSSRKAETAFKTIILAARKAFPGKTVTQLINYAPFDLFEFADWLADNNIGIGGPDVKLTGKKANLQKLYAKYVEHHNKVPTGPNIEWDNYIDNKMPVTEILDGAIEMTSPWYLFWLDREPYFTDEVIPAARRQLPLAERFYEKAQQ